MTVYVRKAGLTYISVPKCACSSLKHFCFEVEHGAPFAELASSMGLGRLHQTFVSQKFARFEARLAEGDYGGDLVAVVRPPVDRLVSCYANKVIKADALRSVDPQLLLDAGLPAAPNLATFLANLEDYRRVSKVIERHSRPLSYYLGCDPDRYFQIFDISQIEQLARLVNNRAGTVVGLGHLHKAVHRPVVSPDLVKKIEKDFAEDIDLFGQFMNSNRQRNI